MRQVALVLSLIAASLASAEEARRRLRCRCAASSTAPRLRLGRPIKSGMPQTSCVATQPCRPREIVRIQACTAESKLNLLHAREDVLSTILASLDSDDPAVYPPFVDRISRGSDPTIDYCNNMSTWSIRSVCSAFKRMPSSIRDEIAAVILLQDDPTSYESGPFENHSLFWQLDQSGAEVKKSVFDRARTLWNATVSLEDRQAMCIKFLNATGQPNPDVLPETTERWQALFAHWPSVTP